jgi:hypothetical protein
MNDILEDSATNRKDKLLESLIMKMGKAGEMDNRSRLNAYMILAEKYRKEIECHFAILRSAKDKMDNSGFNQVMYSVLAYTGNEKLKLMAEFFIAGLKDVGKGRDIYRLALDKNNSADVLVTLLESVTAFLPEEELISEVLSKIIQKIEGAESLKFYAAAEAAMSKLKSRHFQIRYVMDLFAVRRNWRDRYRLSALVYNILGDRKWALELCEMAMRDACHRDPAFALEAARHLYRLTGDGTLSMPPLEIYMKIMENVNNEEEES